MGYSTPYHSVSRGNRISASSTLHTQTHIYMQTFTPSSSQVATHLLPYMPSPLAQGSLQLIKFQRFFGPKIYVRHLPCKLMIKFRCYVAVIIPTIKIEAARSLLHTRYQYLQLVQQNSPLKYFSLSLCILRFKLLPQEGPICLRYLLAGVYL